MPQAILPPTKKQMPPNMRRSVTSDQEAGSVGVTPQSRLVAQVGHRVQDAAEREDEDVAQTRALLRDASYDHRGRGRSASVMEWSGSKIVYAEWRRAG
jgi:hypothetical protein